MVSLVQGATYPVDDSKEALGRYLLQKNFDVAVIRALANFDVNDFALLSKEDISAIVDNPSVAIQIQFRNRDHAAKIHSQFDITAPLLERISQLEEKITREKKRPQERPRSQPSRGVDETIAAGRDLQQATPAPTTNTQLDMLGTPATIVFGKKTLTTNATLSFDMTVPNTLRVRQNLVVTNLSAQFFFRRWSVSDPRQQSVF